MAHFASKPAPALPCGRSTKVSGRKEVVYCVFVVICDDAILDSGVACQEPAGAGAESCTRSVGWYSFC